MPNRNCYYFNGLTARLVGRVGKVCARSVFLSGQSDQPSLKGSLRLAGLAVVVAFSPPFTESSFVNVVNRGLWR